MVALENDHVQGEPLGEREVSQVAAPSVFALRDAVYGAAVGDALGVPYEFKTRGSFTCVGMVSGGSHGQPAGTFSDDTSMMLALCDSIRAQRGVDAHDMFKRFRDWAYNGAYAIDGKVFDIGGTVSTALARGQGCANNNSNGNGSLMRIAPLAYTTADDDQIRAASAITHAHRISTDSCVCFAHLLRNLMDGNGLQDSLKRSIPSDAKLSFLGDVITLPREKVRSGGYVLDTLGAAIWCFANTDNYADCVLEAVNLGRDTDTTACVAGALAGAVYGYDAIPSEWLDALRGKDIIEKCLFSGIERERS